MSNSSQQLEQSSALSRVHWLLLFGFSLMMSTNYAHVGSWPHFKDAFITPEGRVIDTYQNITHSEGQGYGMLLAVRFDDRQTFENLWEWTSRKLQVRNDHLIAWSYGPKPNGTEALLDKNNATDGDILIAFALLEGARQWSEASFRDEAVEILDDILKYLAVDVRGMLLLQPGEIGFLTDERLRWNPSYQIIPAFELFAREHDERWGIIAKDAERLIKLSMQNPSRLPSDWLEIELETGNLSLDKTYGYEAVRVLLYQLWGKSIIPVAGLINLMSHFEKQGDLPASLSWDGSTTDKASAGFYMIYANYLEAMNQSEHSRDLLTMARLKLINEKDNYYSQVLYLLAGVPSYG